MIHVWIVTGRVLLNRAAREVPDMVLHTHEEFDIFIHHKKAISFCPRIYFAPERLCRSLWWPKPYFPA